MSFAITVAHGRSTPPGPNTNIAATTAAEITKATVKAKPKIHSKKVLATAGLFLTVCFARPIYESQ